MNLVAAFVVWIFLLAFAGVGISVAADGKATAAVILFAEVVASVSYFLGLAMFAASEQNEGDSDPV